MSPRVWALTSCEKQLSSPLWNATASAVIALSSTRGPRDRVVIEVVCGPHLRIRGGTAIVYGAKLSGTRAAFATLFTGMGSYLVGLAVDSSYPFVRALAASLAVYLMVGTWERMVSRRQTLIRA